jgi:hypothetical protein
MAVQYTAAGIASTLMATTPIIILLPSWVLLPSAPHAEGVLGAVVSVVACRSSSCSEQDVFFCCFRGATSRIVLSLHIDKERVL